MFSKLEIRCAEHIAMIAVEQNMRNEGRDLPDGIDDVNRAEIADDLLEDHSEQQLRMMLCEAFGY